MFFVWFVNSFIIKPFNIELNVILLLLLRRINFHFSLRVTLPPKPRRWSFVPPRCARRRRWRFAQRRRATFSCRRWASNRSSRASYLPVWRHRLWHPSRRRWFKRRAMLWVTNFRERSFSLDSPRKNPNRLPDQALLHLVISVHFCLTVMVHILFHCYFVQL
jgi:hypothetical protein